MANKQLLLAIILEELENNDTNSCLTYNYAQQMSADDFSILTALTSVRQTEHGTFIKDFYEKTIPLYNVSTFRSHFRMSRQTVQVKLICPVI